MPANKMKPTGMRGTEIKGKRKEKKMKGKRKEKKMKGKRKGEDN